MSRLRSLQSPIVRNTPSPSATPPRSRQSTSNPYPQDTSTYHRKLRAILGEVDNCMDAWDEAAKDGFMALKGIVDEGTEMDNLAAMEVSVSRPPLIPHYVEYNKHLDQTVTIFQRLNKILAKLRILQETARQLLAECLTLRDVEFSLVDPLWTDCGGTWTLERFVVSLDPLASHHALHLLSLQTQHDKILHPSMAVSQSASSKSNLSSNSSGNTTFDVQKAALEKYRDLMYRSDRQTWRSEWEELVEGEMGGWLDGGDSDSGEAGAGNGNGNGGGRSGYSSPGGGKKARGGRGGSVEPPD